MKRNSTMVVVMVLGLITLMSAPVLASDKCADSDRHCCTVEDVTADADEGRTRIYDKVDLFNTDASPRYCDETINFDVGTKSVEITDKMSLDLPVSDSVEKFVLGNEDGDPVTFVFKNANPDRVDPNSTDPIFDINGINNVMITNIAVQSDGTIGKGRPFIRIKDATSVTLSEITLRNLPAGAIVIEGAQDITITELHIEEGVGLSAETIAYGTEEIVPGVITVIGSTAYPNPTNIRISGSDLTNIVGNGIVLYDVNKYSIGDVQISYSASAGSDSIGIIIHNSKGVYDSAAYSIGGGTKLENVVGTGVQFVDVDNSTGSNTIISDLTIEGASTGGQTGLILDKSKAFTFSNLTVKSFVTGIDVKDSDTNSFKTDSVVVEGIFTSSGDVLTAASNGIVFEGTSEGNLVQQVNLDNHPFGCGVVLNTSGTTKLDQIMAYNTDKCGVGVGSSSTVSLFDETYSGDSYVALYTMSQDNILLDVLNTALGTGIKSVELHKLMLTSTARSTEASLIGSPYDISDLSKTSLPAKLGKDKLGDGGSGYYFMVLLQDQDKTVYGVWRGYASQGVIPEDEQYCTTDTATGTTICDSSCYYDPETQSHYRIYNYGVDVDGDGVADDDIDLDGFPDAIEDTAIYSQAKGSDGLWTVKQTLDYTAPTSMNCVPDSNETKVNDPDSDGDTVLDGTEWNTLHTSPVNNDTDDDTLSDYDEDPDRDGCSDTAADEDGDGRPDCYHPITLDDGTKIMETNPLVADSDVDGVDDGVERHRGTNPWKKDSDGDTVNDDTDLCPMQIDRTTGCYVGGAKLIDVFCVPNSLRYENVMDDISEGEVSGDTYDCGDADSDGLCISQEDKDFDCEYDPLTETDASSADTDNDGTPDGKEDRNGDGIFYPEDITEISSPILPDSDGDCRKDGFEDRNGDGYIDLAAGETYPNLLDSDLDGLSDGEEDTNRLSPELSCNGNVDKGETSPSKIDSDGDGLIDGSLANSLSANPLPGVDVAPFSTDPNTQYYFHLSGIDVDMDGDGVNDGDEDNGKDNMGGNGRHDASAGECDARYADTDGDGLTDNHEMQYGTNCNSADTDGDGRSDTEELVPGWTCVETTDVAGRTVCTPPTAEQEGLYLSNADGHIVHQLDQSDPTYYSKGCSLSTANYHATFGQVLPIIGLMGLFILVLAGFRVKKT